MKVLMIDDHVSFCEGLIAALATVRPDYQVSFESSVDMVPSSLIGKTDYDLFIMDLMMPGLGGIGIITYLNKNRNLTPVIVMSSVEDPAVIRQVFQLGITGFVPKSYGVHQIVDAIEFCRKGNVHVPESMAHLLGADTSKDNVPISADAIKLTKRQVDILSCMDKGMSNQEIADTLFIGKATVKTHINRLFKLFDVTNRVSCLRAARQAAVIIA